MAEAAETRGYLTGRREPRKISSFKLIAFQDGSPLVRVSRLQRESGSLSIEGCIDDKKVRLKLDTGATHTILRGDLHKGDVINSSGVKLRTATGEEADVKGKARKCITICGVTVQHEFIVAEIIDEVIVGMDFMVKHGFDLDLKNMILRYGNIEMILNYGDEADTNIRRVVVQEDERIPANSETIIWAKVDGTCTSQAPFIIEENKGESVNGSILVARSVACVKNNALPVRVFNTAQTPVVLKAGESIANCEVVDSVVDCESEFKESTCRAPKQYDDFVRCWTNDLPNGQKTQANKFFAKYSCVFAQNGKLSGRTKVGEGGANTSPFFQFRNFYRKLNL